jgi:hypothetical protein
VGNGRITLGGQAAPDVPATEQGPMDEVVEIGLVSVSFFVVNKRLKNIYVAFTDFNQPATAYIVS